MRLISFFLPVLCLVTLSCGLPIGVHSHFEDPYRCNFPLPEKFLIIHPFKNHFKLFPSSKEKSQISSRLVGKIQRYLTNRGIGTTITISHTNSAPKLFGKIEKFQIASSKGRGDLKGSARIHLAIVDGTTGEVLTEKAVTAQYPLPHRRHHNSDGNETLLHIEEKLLEETARKISYLFELGERF